MRLFWEDCDSELVSQFLPETKEFQLTAPAYACWNRKGEAKAL